MSLYHGYFSEFALNLGFLENHCIHFVVALSYVCIILLS